MKQLFKRITAALLLLCMVSSFVVPATFADTANTETTEYHLDFYNLAEYAALQPQTTSKTLNSTCGCGADHTLKDHLDGEYDQLGWKIAGTSAADYSFIVPYRYDSLLFTIPDAKWVAITLKVANTGNYDITLTGGDGHNRIQAYLFDGALTQQQLTEEMGNSTTLSDHFLASEVRYLANGMTVANDMPLEAGEYTLVFKNTRGEDIARNLFLKTISLTREVEEESTEASSTTAVETLDQYVYHIDFQHTTEYGSLLNPAKNTPLNTTCKCGEAHTIKDHLDTLYAELGWKYADNGTADAENDYSNISARGSTSEGMIFTVDKSGWVAFTLKTPAANKYAVSLIGNGGDPNNATMDIYLFAGALSRDEIKGKMADRDAVVGNRLATGYLSAEDENAIVGEVEFTSEEYTLVVFNTRSDKTRNLNLRTIQLDKVENTEASVPSTEASVPTTQETTNAATTEATTEVTTEVTTEATTETTVPVVTGPPQPLVENEWDFEFYNNSAYANLIGTRGKLSDTCGCGAGHTVKEHLDTLYTTSGWKVAGTSNGNYDSVWVYESDGTGMLFQPVAGGWIAITLWVTEAGKHTLYATAEGKGQSGINTYIFEGDLSGDQVAEKLAASNSSANLVRKGVAIAAGNTGAIGSWDFAPGAYTLVIRNTRSDSGRNCWISKITLGEFDGIEATVPSTEATEPGVQQQDNVWNFDYYNDPAYATLAAAKGKLSDDCGCGAGHTVKEHLDTLYESFGWKMGATSNGNYDNIQVYSHNNAGLVFQPVAGGWIAIALNVKATGKHTLYATAKGDGQSGINTYIFEGELSQSQIADKLSNSRESAANLVRKGVAIAAGETGAIGSWDFNPGTYTLVIRNTNMTKARNFWLSKIVLGEHDGIDPTVSTDSADSGITHTGVCDGHYTDGVYNFALYTDDAFKAMFYNDKGDPVDAGYGGVCYNCGKTIKECLAEQFASNQTNWIVEATSFYEVHIMAKGGDEGMRMRYTKDANGQALKNQEGNLVEKTGNWIAFRVKVPKAGNYNISFSKSYLEYNYNANVYIFPATAETMSADAVAAAMTEKNLAGKVSFARTAKTFNLGDWTFGDGEYIVVMQNTEDSQPRIYLSGMTFESIREPSYIEPADKMVYNFDLAAKDPSYIKKGMTGFFSKDPVIYMEDQLGQMYKDGQIHWQYELSKDADAEKQISFREGCLRWKSTKNFKNDTPWSVFRIKNPGTATYDIRIAVAAASSIYADIYIVPASRGNMDAQKIEALMTEENLLVKDATFPDKGSFYMGEYTFGMEEEYFVIFHFKKGVLMYLNNIQVTKDGLVADEAISKKKTVNGAIYNFDLLDAMDGIIDEGKVDLVDYVDQINSWYASGVLNWKWTDSSDDMKGVTKETMDLPNGSLHRLYRKTGMRMSTKTLNSWTAYKIKSPGSGTFTVTMNYAAYYKSGTVAIYVVPADSENPWEATDSSNRIGKVCLSEDTTEYIDGRTAFVGYYDFEAGKEYILVFEVYEHSLFSTHSYNNISQIVMEKGKLDYEGANDKVVQEIAVVEDCIPVLDPGAAGGLTTVNGHYYYVLPCEGGVAMVYDLNTKELVDTFRTGQARTQDVVVDKDGIVYIGGSTKQLVIYDPYTQEVEKVSFLGRPEFAEYTGYFSMCVGDDGKIYLGLYYGSGLAVYDPKTKDLTYLGQFAEGGTGLRGLTYHKGYLYFSVWNNAAENRYNYIHKYDIATGQIVGTCDVDERRGTASYIQFMTVIDDDFLMASGMSGSMQGDITIDIETMELMDTPLPSAMALTATAETDGVYYFCCVGNGMYQYDTKTKEFSKIPAFTTTVGMRNHNMPLIELDGNRYYFTYRNNSEEFFRFYLYNMDTMETEEWMGMEVRNVGGAPIRAPMSWGEGSNRLSFGAFNIHEVAIYNIETGKIEKLVPSGGQSDSQVLYKGKYYVGAYSATVLDEIDIEAETYTQRWKLDHGITGQKRIHTLAAGDDKIFAGTIPNTNQYGGAIVVYDTTNGEWFYERNIIQDQAILKLLYDDKLVFGASTRMGGSGSTVPVPSHTSAVIFVYDYETREVIATLDPRDYISGLASPVLQISALELDPNFEENGRFWAVVSETMFTFTYDRETKKFSVQEVFSFDKTTYATNAGRTFFAREILFDTENNYIYFSFDTKGGFQRLTVQDLKADKVKVTGNKRLLRENPMEYTMGDDGNIYYGSDADLMMYPLNVTDEDWEIAGAVDDMILAIPKEVTLEDEAAIKSARSAYDNLSWYYKALIQNAEKLLEIETDLLEAKIAAVDLEKVDADSLPELKEMRDEYEGQNERQQRYTKNYAHLKEAYNKASKLNDERVAAEMQKRIDALEPLFPMTLEVEPTVVAIRTDFDALSGSQQILIDTTLLKKAEAEIAVLRAEFVKYVESLIQAIPEEITLEAEPAITAAREGVDKLYPDERKQVSYSKLTLAESKLRTLQQAKKAAEKIDELIKDIGIVTLGDKTRIAYARAGYNALNETARQFVTKYKKLQRAEFILKALQTWGIPVITVANAGIAFAVVWFVPSLHQKVFKGKKKEETPAGEEKESI